MPEPIALAMLRAKNACDEQLREFERLFGDTPVTVTEELCVQHASRFNWDWAARNLLTAKQRKAYLAFTASTRASYAAAIASEWEAFDTATASAREAYDAATASAREAYDAATASAWEAYDAALANAREARNAATARAWALCYLDLPL